MAENTILAARGIHKSYGGVHAVNDVSFTVETGRMVAIIGPNGAGKSTCFNMLGGQIRPDSGHILLEGREIGGLDPQSIWQLGVGRTFQITATFASMTVRENIQTVLLSHYRKLRTWWMPASRQFNEEADTLLGLTGMRAQADRMCGILAYGDLKRVELAMALASQPKLLLMDEPTAGMAPSERVELMRLARSLVESRRLSIVFTEHDMDVVFGQADHIIVLNRGRIIAAGTPESIRRNAQVQEVYLGGGTMYGAA